MDGLDQSPIETVRRALRATVLAPTLFRTHLYPGDILCGLRAQMTTIGECNSRYNECMNACADECESHFRDNPHSTHPSASVDTWNVDCGVPMGVSEWRRSVRRSKNGVYRNP